MLIAVISRLPEKPICVTRLWLPGPDTADPVEGFLARLIRGEEILDDKRVTVGA